MANKISEDPRIDKRIKDVFGLIEIDAVMTEHDSREEMMAFEETEEAQAGKEIMHVINNAPHYKEVVPSDGLSTTKKEFISDPDGNTIKIQYIRPDTEETLPCVYYIHGGGMEISSCFDELYQAWGRCIARQNVAVAMVDFRNARWPSSASRPRRLVQRHGAPQDGCSVCPQPRQRLNPRYVLSPSCACAGASAG